MANFDEEVAELMKRIEKFKDENNDDKFIETLREAIDYFTEFRNRQMKKMKYYSPTKQRIKRLQLIDLDNKIEQFKQKLKKFEDDCEQEKQVEVEKEAHIDELLAQAEANSNKLYIIIKHQKPQLFQEFHNIRVQDLTPEEEKEFLEHIAHLEATKLEDILAGKD